MNYRLRFFFIVFLLCLAMLGLVWRMIDLMVLDRHFLLGQGDARSLRIVSIPAYRGIITDRNGAPLAISVPVNAVWIDPKEFVASPSQLQQLSQLLGMNANQIEKIDTVAHKREFAYLQRGVTPYIAAKIKELQIPGVFLKNEFRRFYPEGEVAAQLLGFTNVDDHGQEGMELEYNDWLAGEPGRKRILIDRYGRTVADVDLLDAAVPGHNLALSIDRRIQYLAYSVLKEAIKDRDAASGSVVVLDIKTNEVLAMASLPSYNPNNRPKLHDGRFRNRAMTDVTEPGSTTKAFSVANALTSGKYTPNSPIDTHPGFMRVEGHLVQDDDHIDNGVLTVTGVLEKSSNVGVTKMTLSLPPDMLYETLIKIGYGQRTDTGFPGEVPGLLRKHRVWRPFALATLSFGYGVNLTNIQLARAYSILANYGVKKPVSLLKIDHPPQGRRIMSANTAEEILTMLEYVADDGTGRKARVPGYRVGGKTGTVRMLGPDGYEANHHTTLFAGIAPVSNPRLVVTVIIKDPLKDANRKGFYAAYVSAPVFSKVMGGALRILDIAPDKKIDSK